MLEKTGQLEAQLLPAYAAETTLKRTGTLWTAVAHIITGVIGSGVLSLAWSMAQLGWIAGPLVMFVFAAITLLSTYLLSDCYRSPDPECGPRRHTSYHEAVDVSLGKKNAWLCNFFVQVSLCGNGIAYTITSAISMRAIQKSNCYHREGHEAACEYGDTSYMLMFGLVQIILSQIPNFHNIQWLSIVAAIMSFSYASIGFALGLANVVENGYVQGSITGVSASTAVDKVWKVLQAVGDIEFAFPYSLILIEIQDTLRSPPPESETMKKASTISIFITTFFYLCCGGFGYAAFGEDTPGNLLTGFGFYEPYWLVDLANACVVLHLVGGYQVYCQPLFASAEKWLAMKCPSNWFIHSNYTLKVPAIELNPLRLCFRTVFVMFTTGIAIAFPYFNQVLGVLGAVNFWPLTIYFPVEMYFKQRKIESWTPLWIVLRSFTILCFCVTLCTLTASIEGLISARLS